MPKRKSKRAQRLRWKAPPIIEQNAAPKIVGVDPSSSASVTTYMIDGEVQLIVTPDPQLEFCEFQVRGEEYSYEMIIAERTNSNNDWPNELWDAIRSYLSEHRRQYPNARFPDQPLNIQENQNEGGGLQFGNIPEETLARITQNRDGTSFSIEVLGEHFTVDELRERLDIDDLDWPDELQLQLNAWLLDLDQRTRPALSRSLRDLFGQGSEPLASSTSRTTMDQLMRGPMPRPVSVSLPSRRVLGGDTAYGFVTAFGHLRQRIINWIVNSTHYNDVPVCTTCEKYVHGDNLSGVHGITNTHARRFGFSCIECSAPDTMNIEEITRFRQTHGECERSPMVDPFRDHHAHLDAVHELIRQFESRGVSRYCQNTRCSHSRKRIYCHNLGRVFFDERDRTPKLACASSQLGITLIQPQRVDYLVDAIERGIYTFPNDSED